jgi:hypothetical protein
LHGVADLQEERGIVGGERVVLEDGDLVGEVSLMRPMWVLRMAGRPR